MAKKAKGKGKKGGLPAEVQDQILSMSPTDLAVECTFERNAIEALKDQAKKNDQITDVQAKVKDRETQKKSLQAELELDLRVQETKEAYDKAVEDAKTTDQTKLEEEIAELKADEGALKKGFSDDVKDRQKKLKFMDRTLKRHIESGALKRKA